MHKTRRQRRRRGVAASLLAVLLLGVVSLPARAVEYYRQPTVYTRSHNAYEEVPIDIGGKKFEDGVGARLIDSTTYVPLRSFCEAIADETEDDTLTITFQSNTRTATVRTDTLNMSVTDGSYYIVANGRYLYHSHPAVILDDNRLYVPIRLLEKVYSLSVSWQAKTRSVKVDGTPRALESGDSFYDENDLYWLSRIISAESRGEPLLGQIAVGNVVMNRVKSPAYPNSIYGVIFDFRYGTQFTPAATGGIYAKPAPISVIAAKICLDGFSVSDKAIFFYEPTIATSHWIAKNCKYLFTIGAHWFYY